MKLSKLGVVFATACAMLLGSCASNKVSDSDPNVKAGVSAWNFRGPSAATAYWSEIEDAAKKKKWLNYVTLFEAGKEALETTDEVKASNEAKLLSLTNTALNKFSALDPALKIPGNVCEKGNNVTAARIDKLLAAGRLSEAKKMSKTAVSVYGTNSAMKTALAEIAVVEVIQTKKNSLLSQAEKAGEKENFDEKIAAFDAVIAKYPAVEAEVNAAVEGSTVSDEDGVVAAAKAFKKVRQDIRIQRSAAFRDEAYSYKDRMGEEFARQPEEGSGTGKNGAFTIYDTKKHYEQIGQNMDNIYAELEAFQAKYPKDVGKDILVEAKAQKDDLNAKIAQINKEIAVKEEYESRGRTVFPLMIGLFNSAPGSKDSGQKSRPAKFSGTKQTKEDYWWGMVDIPAGKMNDLVITLKDNRTVRVFNQNTKSGKLIEKNGLKDLINRSSKVGNSWPVLNAGQQLKGNKYFIEIQKGKTDSYSGEVVVYESFVVRSR